MGSRLCVSLRVSAVCHASASASGCRGRGDRAATREALNIKKDELETEIEVLTGEVETLRDDLNKTTIQRKVEREENIQTMKEAKEGLAVVKEAITILKAFYSKSARVKESFAQFSPVDEDVQDTSDCFSGGCGRSSKQHDC